MTRRPHAPGTLVLLPSPLLGPVAWEPVAETLREGGHPVLVAQVPQRPRGPGEVLAALAASLPPDEAVVLVPHSNAGLYAPALAETARVTATVFVDAALPSSAPSTPLAPPDFLEFLTGLADRDGLLPPWTRWWGEDDLDRLFPTPDGRRRVEASEPRLPLAYFRAQVRVPAGWAAAPSAYLAFGGTYAPETADARRRGWPVEVLAGGHLHMLHDPEAVADRILHLLDLLVPGRI